MQRGNVSCSAYWSYLYAGGGCLKLSIVLLLFLCTQILLTSTDYFLQFW